MDRITPGIIAIVIGGIVAVLLFVPFVAASYRIRGRMTVGRSLSWAALLVSFLAIWTYTILPAPALTDDYRCSTPNLNLLTDLRDIISLQQAGGSLVANAALQVVVLNIIFFVPLGFLLRSLFGWGIVRAVVTGFLVSLAVETTQLTGIWGLYPCSYRLFSVSDLMHNTLGALIGSLIGLAVLKRRQPTESRADTPHVISTGQRVMGMVSDGLIYLLVSLLAALGASLVRTQFVSGDSAALSEPMEITFGLIAAVLVYFVPLLVTGSTLGERAVMVRGEGGFTPAVVSRAVRGLVGLGGVIALSEFVPVLGDLLALVLAAALVVSVTVGKSRDGLATRAAGMHVVDARDSALREATRHTNKAHS